MDEAPDELSTVLDSGWEHCPSTSHVSRVRLINKVFADTGEPSELWIVFKEYIPKTTRGTYRPEQQYIYRLPDHTALASVFEALRITAHPGEVIDRELKKTGVPVEGPMAPS